MPSKLLSPAVLALSMLLPLAAPAAPDEIAVGDPMDKVRAVLGEPPSHIRSGSYELWQYDRGRVELRDGVVAEVNLVSAEEAAALKAAREQAYREAQARQAAWRAQRLADGTAERDRALANPEFLASSGARQVEYWDRFRLAYPEVSINSEYAAALAKRDRELAEAESQRRLAAMEARVTEAEERAKRAEEEAEDARRDARRRTVYYGSPRIYYPAPCPPVTNCPPYRPTYPATGWNAGYPYTHGYTVWGNPQYVVNPSNIRSACTTGESKSGLHVRISN